MLFKKCFYFFLNSFFMDKLFFYTDAHDNSCKMKESQEKFGFRRAAHCRSAVTHVFTLVSVFSWLTAVLSIHVFTGKTAIPWPRFKRWHDSWRCKLTVCQPPPPPPRSPSLSGDHLTLRGTRHDRFGCHPTATWPSATPTPQAFPPPSHLWPLSFCL